jgi:hypothetical protein
VIETLAFVFLSCQDARQVADRAIITESITKDVAIEVIIELDIASGGKCNLPGISNGHV